MNEELLEAQKVLEEARRTKRVILETSSRNGNGGSQRMGRHDHPRPENDDGRPESWVCPVCGHKRGAVWDAWKGDWYLDDSPCETCVAIAFKKKTLALKRERTISRYGLDQGEYARMTFDNYVPQNSTQAKAKEAAMKRVDAWKAGNWRIGMALISPNIGVGKTHLAIAAAREGMWLYNPRNYECILTIWDVPTLLSEIRNSYNGGGPGDIMEPAMASGILLLDDLGTEHYGTESWYQSTLYEIFNARWKNHRTTIFTTNFAPDDLRSRLGERVWSRLGSMIGKPILLTGEDFRLKSRRAG